MKNLKTWNKISNLIMILFIIWTTLKMFVWDIEPSNWDLFFIGACIYLDFAYFPHRIKKETAE